MQTKSGLQCSLQLPSTSDIAKLYTVTSPSISLSGPTLLPLITFNASGLVHRSIAGPAACVYISTNLSVQRFDLLFNKDTHNVLRTFESNSRQESLGQLLTIIFYLVRCCWYSRALQAYCLHLPRFRHFSIIRERQIPCQTTERRTYIRTPLLQRRELISSLSILESKEQLAKHTIKDSVS